MRREHYRPAPRLRDFPLARFVVRVMFQTMSLAALLALAAEKQLTVTLRVKPLLDGYTVLVQAGYLGGARPLYEKHFAPDVPRADAIDQMARLPLDFFKPYKGTHGAPRAAVPEGAPRPLNV